MIQYIKLSDEDLTYLNNSVVVCWDGGFITFANLTDLYFENHERFEWFPESEYKYFLIPLDLVPAIAHYSGFVKQTFPDLIFDVVLESQVIPVEGVDVTVPSNQVKMIPCNCTHWSEEGLIVLDAVIENWNTSRPDKQINFQYAFESYDLFKSFMDEQVQV